MDFFKDSFLKLSESDKNQLIRLLTDKSPEKNFPSPPKKQRTLDGWLIKRNDSSKEPEDRLKSKQATKSNIDNVTESVKNTCVKEDNLLINHEKGSRKDKSNDPDCISKSVSINHKSIVENENLVAKKNKYNLRTKTKNSKLVQQTGGASNEAITENNQADTVINKINHSSKSTAPKSQSEAFSKLNQICQEMSIDVSEILKNKNVESVLKDPTILNKDAIVFIGALKSNTGETSPIVHLAKSKKKLLELLVSKQKKQLST